MKALRWISWITILSMVFSLCASPQTVKAQSKPPQAVTRDTLFVPGEVVVGFKSGGVIAKSGAQALALAGQVSAQVVGSFGNTALLSFAPDADVQALAGQLASAPGVQYAEPNYISWIPEADAKIKAVKQQLSQVTRTDPNGKQHQISVKDLLAMRSISHGKAVLPTYANDMFNSWGVNAISAEMIWNEPSTSPQVCVLDTGVDLKHPDLAGKVVAGYDFINNDTSVVDDNGHGTHVSGTIAAKTNDGIGPAGISNGQVLAVKVLTAQGWGTDFDIAQGINYCATKPAVKVLSMSLGGPDSQTEYDALYNAIHIYGKLVAAAAGNDSTDDRTYSYPAAWSDDPLIGGGLISVAAARSPWTRYDDSDGSYYGDIGIYDGTDTNYYYNCATDFSNYGDWVNIVAPGENIYSTTPYNSPFWLNLKYNDSPSYDWMSGTSMATPHVAAAAARIWSLVQNKTISNSAMKGLLISSGDSLDIAEDPQFTSASDQSQGYYGDYTADGPFCWPESMSNATYLDVARAMGRGVIESEVTDATTGLPLVGATVQAVIDHTTTIKASGAVASPYADWVDLINLPTNYTYTLKVSAAGYTSGIQSLMSVIHVEGGYFMWGSPLDAPVPPLNKNFTAVANWMWGDDLSLFLWLPQNTSGVVGPWDPYTGPYDPFKGQGTLVNSPYARFYRYAADDGVSVESIGVVSSGAYPFYPSATGNQAYNILLADNNDGYDLNEAYPVVRVWYSGIAHYLSMIPNCGVGDNWWHAGSFYRSGTIMQYVGDDTCGTGGTSSSGAGIWPYSKQGGVTVKAMDQPAK
jgi:subtilisin family serine protease